MTRDISLDPSTHGSKLTPGPLSPTSSKSTTTSLKPSTTVNVATLIDMTPNMAPTEASLPSMRRSFSSSTCSPCSTTHLATPEWASPDRSFKTYVDQLNDNSVSGDEDNCEITSPVTLRTLASSMASIASSKKRGCTPRSSSLPLSASSSKPDVIDLACSVKKPKHCNKRVVNTHGENSHSINAVEKKQLPIAESPNSTNDCAPLSSSNITNNSTTNFTPTTVLCTGCITTTSTAPSSSHSGPSSNGYVSFPSLNDETEEHSFLNGKEIL